MHFYLSASPVFQNMDLIDRLQLMIDAPHGGIEVVRYGHDEATACFRAVAPWCLSAGFVPVVSPDEPGDVQRDLPDTLRHRHVAIVCQPGASTARAIRWLRTLAHASPRRHLVLAKAVLRPGVDSHFALHPTTAPGLGTESSPHQRRAERWRARGRPRIGDRWAVAAIEAARRHGDLERAGALDIELIDDLIARGCLDEARRRIHPLLASDADWRTYLKAAMRHADVLIGKCELHTARVWTSSVVAEADLRNESLVDDVSARLAELDFWEGGPMRSAAPHLCGDPDTAGWSALHAWAGGDTERLRTVATALGAGAARDPRCEYWRLLIDLLTIRSPAPAETISRGKTVRAVAERLARSRDRRSALVDVAVARELISNGHHSLAHSVLSRARSIGPESLACRRLLALSRSHPDGPRLPAADPPGVVALASWRNQMQLVDGLPDLLALLEEADDELSVLSGGCDWLCRRAGAIRAAIVSADGSALLAATGWRQPDLAGEIAEVLRGPDRDVRAATDGSSSSFGVSVRSLGVTVAFVIVRGRPADRPMLQSSALTLATFCGPAVRARLDALSAAERGRHQAPELIGSSPLMAAVRDSVVRAAAAPFSVLIEGESGTGKELVARALHRMSARRDRRLSAVNCAALTDELVEAELFGHVRGAFTGATGPRVGLFEESHGGTLFLDEVTELSPRAQAKLLRVLQEREIRRVGENQPRPVDVRILAACNVAIADAVAGGRFRDDLRFRLAVIRISLPPLRERVEDIPALAMTFWRRYALEAGTRALLGPDALARLTRHRWPGNVRELQNAVAALVVAAPLRGRVTARHVEQVLSQTTSLAEMPGVRLEAARRTFEQRVILGALTRHGGRRHAAAIELGLTRQGLAKAMRRLGLSNDEPAAGVA